MLVLLFAGASWAELPTRVEISAGSINPTIELKLEHVGHSYRDSAHVVDDARVARVLALAAGKPVHNLDATRLGVTQTLVDRGLREVGWPARRLADPQRLVELLFASRWTDDYATTHLRFVYADGHELKIDSDAQHAFMLPWRVEVARHITLTYDPELSRAIAALLPDDVPTKARVAGTPLGQQLAATLGTQPELPPAQSKLSNEALASIKKRFTIRSSSRKWGMPFDTFAYGGIGWSLVLVPPNIKQLFVALHLSDEHADSAPFLRDIDDILARVQREHWLTDYLAKHRSARLYVHYYDDAALSDYKVLSIAGMLGHRAPNAPRLDEVKKSLARAVLVEVVDGDDFDAWIMLPNGQCFAPLGSHLRGLPEVGPGEKITPNGQPAPSND